ncbi:hypothetical protein L2E82_17503 [Cichorium intybus]|uniref:Uncharacterized protein n=1 Tax=Cichorium intybus TaxID=13427 RepID=A0ACB9F8H9_CICIN|nr:hypothetical protein L2E82_17503 [Cichorium intybus]
MYRKGNQGETIMGMHSMLTLYESFMEKHSSVDSAASGLSLDVFLTYALYAWISVGCGMLLHRSIFGLDLKLM